jgi:hypothetical protein
MDILFLCLYDHQGKEDSMIEYYDVIIELVSKKRSKIQRVLGEKLRMGNPLSYLLLSLFISPLFSQSTEDSFERWQRIQDYPDYSAYRIIGSLQQSYPTVISGRFFKNGEWTFQVNGVPFYWAGGRLLPQEALEDRDKYSPYPFYYYPSEYEPDLMLFLGERQDMLTALLEQMEESPLNRHPGFYDALYRIHDEDSAWEMMKTVYFLGFKVTVHRDIMEDLARVEETLLGEKENNEELRVYLASLSHAAGYSWRPIAGTASRSNHSYGFAVDFIPRDYKGKNAYWRWSRDFFDQWYNLPWEERYRPPEAFVRAFEEEGFIWGGKWLLFDSIHFEYRPEIGFLNGK